MGEALRDAVEMPYGMEMDFCRPAGRVGAEEIPQGTEMDVEQELKPLFAALADRMLHARAEHDWPTTATDAKAKMYALAAILGEWQELVEAVTDGQGRAREKDEALDVIVTAARVWLGDHLPEGEK